ncbi:MAG: hypothetical protein PHQ53_02760 [Candidatus Krumholzibacteria bacterium]|nr:hypothetical protein [Candidatus Krumholzibacteria bacterium]
MNDHQSRKCGGLVIQTDHDALAMIRTPLQLLNAMEARRHFDLQRTALMIVEYSGHGIPPFDLSQVDPADWTRVEIVDLNPVPRPQPHTWLDHPRFAHSEKVNVLRQHYRRRVFDQALRPWRGVPNLLLGNYLQGWFRHAAQRCPRARCILLDDGTDTLRIAGERARRDSQPPRVSLWRRPKAWWYQRYANWDMRQRRKITFFSSFDLELPPGDQLVPNRYDHARRQIEALPQDRRCLFLGQPLVEDGYLTPEEFSRLIAGVKLSLDGLELFYVPHRREHLAELTPLLQQHGIARLDLDKAFEFHLLAAAAIPAVVASFFSSALDNCRLICGDRVRVIAFRLPAASLLVAHDYVNSVYDYFVRAGAGVIEIVEPGRRLT